MDAESLPQHESCGYSSPSQPYPRTVSSLTDRTASWPQVKTYSVVISELSSNTWRTSIKLTTVHITGGNTITATSAFPMELLAIIASLQLATFTQTPVTEIVTEIVTDSLASCHRVRRIQKDIHATPKYTSLTQPLSVFASCFPGIVRWTNAHPERRNSMSMNWSIDDCLLITSPTRLRTTQ